MNDDPIADLLTQAECLLRERGADWRFVIEPSGGIRATRVEDSEQRSEGLWQVARPEGRFVLGEALVPAEAPLTCALCAADLEKALWDEPVALYLEGAPVCFQCAFHNAPLLTVGYSAVSTVLTLSRAKGVDKDSKKLDELRSLGVVGLKPDA